MILAAAWIGTAGCAGSAPVLLSYTDTNIFNGYDIMNYTDTVVSDLSGERFCIVTDEQNHMIDEAITAPSVLLAGVDSNEVIFANNVYEQMYPASITKLLTALVTLKYADLDDIATVSYNASHIPVAGAKLCGFAEGDRISVETLLGGLLVYSGNDAGIVLAEHIAGTEEAFVEMMNEEALALGAVDTHFTNSHGLHNDEHYTTVYDMYLVFRKLLDYETFLAFINLPEYTAAYRDAQGNPVSREFENSNLYISGRVSAPSGVTVIGGKTGTTSNAGYCLITYFRDGNGNGYIAEIFKASNQSDLYTQMSHLMELIP